MEFETKECPECGGVKGVYSLAQGQVFPCDQCGGFGYVEDYERPIKKGNTMNYSTAVMLINPKIRAIKAIYKPDVMRPDGKSSMNEPRVIYKTLDPDVAKGDLVIVESHTRHGMTVVLVDEADIDVDFESETPVRWIVDKVRTADFKNIQKEEGKWIDALKASEKRRKREEIKKNMLAMYDDEKIERLPIASMGAAAEIESKPE